MDGKDWLGRKQRMLIFSCHDLGIRKEVMNGISVIFACLWLYKYQC